MSRIVFFMLLTGLLCPVGSSSTPLTGAIREYLATLPPESEWSAFVTQYSPVYGNYCGADYGDATYETPCLSRLDCICKEHDFGYHLRKYAEADAKFVRQVFDDPKIKSDKNPDYETFLQLMTATLFAGKISGENLYDQVKALYAEYETKPKEAKKSLEELIDENAVFRKKLEEIRLERKKYEEAEAKTPPAKPKTMALSVRPFGFYLGLIGVDYEVKALDWLSVRSFVGGWLSPLLAPTYLQFFSNPELGVSFGAGAKFFVMGEALKQGLYVENRYTASIEVIPNGEGRAFGITPAVLVGFDKVFSLGFHVDVGLGIGYHQSFPFHEQPSEAQLNLGGFVPEFQLSVGWSW